jgi:hypothetical protein
VSAIVVCGTSPVETLAKVPPEVTLRPRIWSLLSDGRTNRPAQSQQVLEGLLLFYATSRRE